MWNIISHIAYTIKGTVFQPLVFINNVAQSTDLTRHQVFMIF